MDAATRTSLLGLPEAIPTSVAHDVADRHHSEQYRPGEFRAKSKAAVEQSQRPRRWRITPSARGARTCRSNLRQRSAASLPQKPSIPIRERAVVNAEFDCTIDCRVTIREKRGSRCGIVQRRAVLADIRAVEQDVTSLLWRNVGNSIRSVARAPLSSVEVVVRCNVHRPASGRSFGGIHGKPASGS